MEGAPEWRVYTTAQELVALLSYLDSSAAEDCDVKLSKRLHADFQALLAANPQGTGTEESSTATHAPAALTQQAGIPALTGTHPPMQGAGDAVGADAAGMAAAAETSQPRNGKRSVRCASTKTTPAAWLRR